MNSSLSPLSDMDRDDDVGQLLYAKLMSDRESGGYAGCISYKEFSSMCNAMTFTEEDAEDCWYDMLMGVPVAKVTDISRFVEIFMFYALSLDKPIGKLFDLWEMERESPLCVTVEPAAAPAKAMLSEAILDSLKRPEQPMEAQKVQKSPRFKRTALVSGFHRYAQNTTSSASKVSHHRERERSADKEKRVKASPVFERLYNDAVRQQKELKEVMAQKEDDENSASVPLPDAKKAEAPRLSSNSPGTFAKPTQSFYAKVAAMETVFDPLEDAPETPRVAYHAPPGPSSFVPNGYIESVAKLRRGAECSRRNQFKDSLRASIYQDPNVSLDGPVLRLPISARDRRAVDIKLS